MPAADGPAANQPLADRERDPAGRPRNARPRDAAGRPLGRAQVGVEPIPDDPGLPPPQALSEAQRLLDDGRPFAAHEVLEASWKAAPREERDLWQGLAQVAVGLTHLQRGNTRGAVALLRRGAARITPYAERAPHGVDVSGVVGYAERLATAIAGDSPPPPAPTLRLTTGPR